MIPFKKIVFLLICSFICGIAWGQVTPDRGDVIQFSGVVVTEKDDEIEMLPFTNVAIMGTNRGTFTELDGFFSIVALKGETIVFSRLGYKTVEYEIPDTLSTNFYSIIQEMSTDTLVLPEAVIYPWPSREHYKIEFLAMDISNPLAARAEENLNPKTLAEMRAFLPGDGTEVGRFQLRENAQSYYYIGQYKPQNILNPLAWKKFYDTYIKKKKEKKKQPIDP